MTTKNIRLLKHGMPERRPWHRKDSAQNIKYKSKQDIK